MKVDTVHTDEEVAQRVQGGDANAFGMIVDRYEAKLMRYGKRFLSQHEDIEDIVQDAFVSAFRNIQSFDTARRFSPWLYRIAHNGFVNALRKNEHSVFIDLDTLLSHHAYEDPAESEREQRDMRVRIDQGLEGIASKYREVLVLHYFEDLSYKDIADVLQVPLGTVSIRMKRAKEALRENVKKHL